MKKISIIIITYNRIEELKETIDNVLSDGINYIYELIIVDNASCDGTYDYGHQLSKQNTIIKYFRLDDNLGVAGGRNYAIKRAKGDILVFLDDDAVWKTHNNLSKIVEKFEEQNNLGVIAFKITNYYTKQIRTEEFPFVNKKLNPDIERYTSTYIGAGHAIKREVFEECGLYPDDFFYGGEELDLSYRIIGKKYNILYCPHIEVLHKQVQKGRMSNKAKWIQVYRNRLISSYTNLRMLNRIVIGTIWFFKIMVKSRNIKVPFVALKRYFSERGKYSISVLDDSAYRYLKKNSGRLYF